MVRKYLSYEMSMREGKRIRVDATHITSDGLRVLFLTPEQYVEYKLVKETGGHFPYTHEFTIHAPAKDYYWTPPTMGGWWVLVSDDWEGSMGVQMVDALLLN